MKALFCSFQPFKVFLEIFRFENTLHSLHECYNPLIFNASKCNEAKKQMSLMSLER